MNSSEALKFVTAFHEKRKLNDHAETKNFFTEDACFSIAGHPGEASPACQATGSAEFDAIGTALVAAWDWLDVDFKTVIAEGDTIMCRYDLTAKHLPSDTTFKTEIVDLYELKDDKIANMRQFLDTAFIGSIVQQGA